VCEEPVVVVLVSSSLGPVTRRCSDGAVGVRDNDNDGDEAVRNGGGGCDDDDEAAT
jgi:hypothetical protein